MRIIITLVSIFFIASVSAKPPFIYTLESDAKALSGEVVMESEKGWRYIGTIKNGKPHGHGIKILSGGMVIYGEWVNGEQQGPGAIYNPEPFDSISAGNYQGRKIQGDGVILIGGEKFEGPFGKLGMPDGKGHCIESRKKTACVYRNGVKVE